MKLKNLLQRRTNPEKFKECFGDGSTSVQKFKGQIFGSIALMLKVYANDANRQDNEKILIVDSVNKAFETLKIVFTRRVEILSKNVDAQQQPGLGAESSKSSTSSDESKCWYPSCISRYLQDCQRQNQASLCKTMTKACATSSEPRLFVAYRKRETRVEYSQQDLLDIANVLIKLKKYLKQHCQRQRLIANGKAAGMSAKSSCCDKAVQCDYLRVSPEVRFFSRASVVINAAEGKPQPQPQQQRRRNSSPSLEYVANYRPEFHARHKSLRSLSSSAIFGLPRDKLNYSRSPRRSRLKRASLEAMRRRTEDEVHRYSNFIEADLSSFHYNGQLGARESATQLDRGDVLAVRKILLDDYITEVKEIIRSELSSGSESTAHESQILDSVRKRIDEDVLLSGRTDSYHSLSPSASYVTARQCPSSGCCCCCCCCLCDAQDSGTCLKFCESTCSKRKITADSRTSYLASKGPYSKITDEDKSAGSTSAKSSQSVDSGVQMDFPRSSTDCSNSSDDLSVNEFKNGAEKKVSSCCLESTASSSGDEMLCRRVESAVRKFTEKLIVCERRAKDRSRSRTVKSQLNPRLMGCTSLADPTRYKSFNCSTRDEMVNCCCSSEDERITGISTPSLVSLSDEEIRV